MQILSNKFKQEANNSTDDLCTPCTHIQHGIDRRKQRYFTKRSLTFNNLISLLDRLIALTFNFRYDPRNEKAEIVGFFKVFSWEKSNYSCLSVKTQNYVSAHQFHFVFYCRDGHEQQCLCHTSQHLSRRGLKVKTTKSRCWTSWSCFRQKM